MGNEITKVKSSQSTERTKLATIQDSNEVTEPLSVVGFSLNFDRLFDLAYIKAIYKAGDPSLLTAIETEFLKGHYPPDFIDQYKKKVSTIKDSHLGLYVYLIGLIYEVQLASRDRLYDLVSLIYHQYNIVRGLTNQSQFHALLAQHASMRLTALDRTKTLYSDINDLTIRLTQVNYYEPLERAIRHGSITSKDLTDLRRDLMTIIINSGKDYPMAGILYTITHQAVAHSAIKVELAKLKDIAYSLGYPVDSS